MICDKCEWKEDCLERKHKGKHEGSCDGFLGECSDPETRIPKRFLTPEDRQPETETRG